MKSNKEKHEIKLDCFACCITKCRVLNQMICRTRECPFYKTTEQFENDRKDAEK